MAAPPLDAAARATLIEAVLEKLSERYVFPDLASQMAVVVRARLAGGGYDALDDAGALCETLTGHLHEVCRDKHLRLEYSAEPQSEGEAGAPSPERAEAFQLAMRLRNFGFEKVERLPGNIGYLDLREFCPPDMGAETAVAAMNFLAHTSALIVDLRKNYGGSPAMVALITSYLFEHPVHLNSMYWREGDRTQQFWTLPYVPGRRYGDGPVYVLTSSETFSGAEEFAYNLQNLKRATVIGEVTGGGAHPVGFFPISPHVAVVIPVGRAINPISGANWEGTGVTPDIAVPQEQALLVAQKLALEHVLAQAGAAPAGPLRELADEARAALAEYAA